LVSVQRVINMPTFDESWFENKTKEEVVKEINELRKNIKRKHRALKQNISEGDELLEKTFKPISDPLRKLVEETKIANEEFVENIESKRLKRKIENEDDNEATPVKRFISNPPQGVKRKRKVNVRHKLNYDSYSDSDDGQNADNQTNKRIAVPVEVENVEMSENNPEETEMEVQQQVERHPAVVDVYETQTSGEQLLKTPEGRVLAKHYIEQNFNGKLAKEYFSKLISGTKTIDHNYGVHVDGNEWKIGSKNLEIDNDDLIIDGKRYAGTRGLYELIFMNNPNEYVYDENDLTNYGNILFDTNVFELIIQQPGN
jgi:hypothetical protein